jgi:hypothetical protein
VRPLGGNDEDRQLWLYDFKIIALNMKLEQDYNLLRNDTPYSIPTIGTSVIRFMNPNSTTLVKNKKFHNLPLPFMGYLFCIESLQNLI